MEEYSGMEQPPLIKQLKTILAEYPDDGQIIKVLFIVILSEIKPSVEACLSLCSNIYSMLL